MAGRLRELDDSGIGRVPYETGPRLLSNRGSLLVLPDRRRALRRIRVVAEETILGRAVIEKGERHDGHGGNSGEHAALDAETAPVEQVSNRVGAHQERGNIQAAHRHAVHDRLEQVPSDMEPYAHPYIARFVVHEGKGDPKQYDVDDREQGDVRIGEMDQPEDQRRHDDHQEPAVRPPQNRHDEPAIHDLFGDAHRNEHEHPGEKRERKRRIDPLDYHVAGGEQQQEDGAARRETQRHPDNAVFLEPGAKITEAEVFPTIPHDPPRSQGDGQHDALRQELQGNGQHRCAHPIDERIV